jgi:hypothetical protein
MPPRRSSAHTGSPARHAGTIAIRRSPHSGSWVDRSAEPVSAGWTMITIRLHYDPNGSGTPWVAEELEAEEVEPGRFRLLETPLFAEGTLNTYDVVSVDEQADGGYSLREVVERSGYHTHALTLSAEFISSPEFVAFCEEVRAAGGNCEQLFGGVVRVVLPPGAEYDPHTAVRALQSPRPPAPRPDFRRRPTAKPRAWWRFWGR